MILLETYTQLLRDPAHWEFELTLMVLFDGLLFSLVWPWIRQHIHRDVRAAEQHDHELIRLLAERVGELESSTAVLGQTLTATDRRLAVARDIAAQTRWGVPEGRVFSLPGVDPLTGKTFEYAVDFGPRESEGESHAEPQES